MSNFLTAGADSYFIIDKEEAWTLVPSNSIGWAESLSFFDRAMEGEFIERLKACGLTASDEIPMPLHLREEYKGYNAFVNGVAERIWKGRNDFLSGKLMRARH